MAGAKNLIPLIILFTVTGFIAYVGYQIYVYANDLANKGVRNMEKKNVMFTKDGMKVGVKEVREEDYVDKTQSVLVNAWTLGKEGTKETVASKKAGKKRH